MGFNFGVIKAAALRLEVHALNGIEVALPYRVDVCDDSTGRGRCFRKVVFGEVAHLSSVVGNGIIVITQGLCDFHCVIQLIAEVLQTVALQFQHIERQRRLLFGDLLRDSRSRELLSRNHRSLTLCVRLIQDKPVGQMRVILLWLVLRFNDFTRNGGVCHDFIVFRLYVVLNELITLYHEPQRRGLHTANRQRSIIDQRIIAAHIDANHQVRNAAGIGRPPHVLKGTVIFEVIERTLQRRNGCVTCRQTVDRPSIVMPAKQFINKELSLFVRVASVYNTATLF